jgi:hypothetical protein
MTDYRELVKQLRQATHGFVHHEAADAIEEQAKEIRRLKGDNKLLEHGRVVWMTDAKTKGRIIAEMDSALLPFEMASYQYENVPEAERDVTFLPKKSGLTVGDLRRAANARKVNET